MDNASRMRIICDPFKKEIKYEWYDSNKEDYVEFDPENSKLASDELVYATIQNRAYEIVNTINEECNVGNVGLEIVFIGTEDDYSDFFNVIKNYYSDVNIECIRDKRYFNTAVAVMPLIKAKFTKISTILEKYKKDKISEFIHKYSDVVKPSISLCMMGLYSAGKSAFINSIIGAELLPSASDPTTAKVCKIYCDNKYQIRFLSDEKECILTFEGSTYKPSSNFEKAIIKKLQGIIESEGRHDEVFHMNRALKILNDDYDDKYKISDIIEIRIPFIKTLLPIEKFNFIIYDTPGSNSANNDRHFETLKNSLDEQTHALPIFLTTPDTMDAVDNDKILKLIEKKGSALDTTNTIVIVNKADQIGQNELSKKRDKCQGLRITKWKSTRIFFLSSIIAVASKKSAPDKAEEWLDVDMFEIFEEKKEKYYSDKRKLFEFNIVDKSKADDIVDYTTSEKTVHLYKNSGLESIEKEIILYARKYALDYKCQQASEYLQKAIDLCVENIGDIENRCKSELENAKEKFDSKNKDLCEKLDSEKNVISTYNSDFQKKMEQYYDFFVAQKHLQDNNSEDKKSIRKELQEHWKKLKQEEKKEKKKKGWALGQIQQYVERKYNDYLMDFSQQANNYTDNFWKEKSKLFRDNCLKIVQDSDALTKNQKDILSPIVLSTNNMNICHMDFDLRSMDIIHKRRFLGRWESENENFYAKQCCNELIKKINDEIRRRNSSVENTNEKNSRKWADELIETIEEKICEFNTGLKVYIQEIKKMKNEIDYMQKNKDMLLSSKDYIDRLLSIQEGGGND